MFTSLADGVKNAVVALIKVAILITVLVAFISWAKSHPASAQAMLTRVMDAVASIITWACNLIIGWTGGTPTR